jgi:hypothetical protein
MKRLLLLVAGLMILMSVNVSAQNVGAIMLYTDAGGVDCNAFPAAGLFYVYLFHEFHNGVTGSFFSLQYNGATGLTPISGINPDPTNILVLGDLTTPGGASFSYGACRVNRLHFATVLYSAIGVVDPCADITVVLSPNSLSQTIEGIDCSATKQVADGSRATFNDPGTECPCGRIVPVENTNWGKVKALYGE